jgi:hypothetical protein
MPPERPKQSRRELADRALNLRRTTERERYLRRRLAAKYVDEDCGYPCSPKQLAKLACAGGGPEMQYRNGLPYYRTDRLRAWVEDGFGPPVTSTSAIKRSRQPALERPADPVKQPPSEARLDKALTRHTGAKSASKRRTSIAPSREWHQEAEARDRT